MSQLLSSLLGNFTQATRLLRLTTPLGSNELLAECARGEETISNGFSVTISALSTNANISLRSLLGQPALLELLTAHEGQLRPFHGHLTKVEHNGANGGMARYTLTLQPWTAFLAHGRDSRVFQDMSVFDILDAVFAAYQGKGTLAPAWRVEVADRSQYPRRSLTTQYQESDLAFAERLMHEEGLFYFFEHTGDSSSTGLGSHEMVIADDNSAFKPGMLSTIRFTQPGAVMKSDSMDRWRRAVRLQTNGVALRSWDYRTRDAQDVSASAGREGEAALVCSDVPGPYAYSRRGQGQRIVDNHLKALDVRRETFTGAGTVRTLYPATTFTLVGEPSCDMADHDDGRRFTVTRVVHLMHNNLSAELTADVVKQVGKSALAKLLDEEQDDNLHAVGKAEGERPLYRNRIDAIRAALPYRSPGSDEHGRALHVRPRVHGQQSAIVVGPPGAVVHTDRDHRVKVQFHWQRGAQSHSRLGHPEADSHTGAPADDTAGTWVRLATPLAPVAGANWGSVAVPRVGQEVLIDFLEGNIDRPVIIGALFNGKGDKDAQGNQIAQGAGAAIGSAPAWFPGEAGAHAHAAVLSGLKSQALGDSQSGAGGYSQLVFDDTPQQARVALQQHAGLHKGTAELNMGHLRHQADNQRLQPAGFGAELKTEHSAALRSGQGMLLSADMRANASSTQMESDAAAAQIDSSASLQETLASTAQKHNARLKTKDGADEPEAPKLIAIEALRKTLATARGTAKVSGTGNQGGSGVAAAYTEPLLQLSAPAGIAAQTPASAVISAKDSISMTAKHDINLVSQQNLFHSVAAGISLFTFGKVTEENKPNQETGITLHAGTGKVSSQSQAGETRITADKTVVVASVTKNVGVSAKQHVMLTAQGAMLKLEGGNISLHCGGTVAFKAGKRDMPGPQSVSASLPQFPSSILTLKPKKGYPFSR